MTREPIALSRHIPIDNTKGRPVNNQRLFNFAIRPQPSDTTCGPTCLHAMYRYCADTISLEEVISGVKYLKDGGTLAAMLACHALGRGYSLGGHPIVLLSSEKVKSFYYL
jgi:hypothetical protein